MMESTYPQTCRAALGAEEEEEEEEAEALS
jgi:hypothetical protein